MDEDESNIRRRAREFAAEDRKRISELVKLRRKAKATQSDVATLIGVSTEWVADLEAYDSDPRLSELRRYQNAVVHFYG